MRLDISFKLAVKTLSITLDSLFIFDYPNYDRLDFDYLDFECSGFDYLGFDYLYSDYS